MKNIVIVLLFVISPLTAFAQIGEKNFIDKNYIEVTGKSEMEIVPDRIYIKVLLSEKDTKNKISVTDLESAMTQKISEIGIDIARDLLIKDMSSNFKSYLFNKSEVLLSKEYQIIVSDGKTAGKVFIELEKLGISNISIEKLDNSKMEQYRNEVKINAVKVARDKAVTLTRAIDQNIGRAIFIQELDNTSDLLRNSNSIMIRGYASGINQNDKMPEMSYDFEKIKIEYSILVRFELN